MSTLELEHLKHTSSSSNNLSTHSDGSLTVGNLQSLNVIGDLTVDSTTLKVDSTNNRVGIGTVPERDLHIKGAAGDPVHLKLEGDPADYARIMFDNGTNDNIGEIRYNYANDTMTFNTFDVTRLTIDNNGHTIPTSLKPDKYEPLIGPVTITGGFVNDAAQFNSNGYLGIGSGISNPSSALHVEGRIRGLENNSTHGGAASATQYPITNYTTLGGKTVLPFNVSFPNGTSNLAVRLYAATTSLWISGQVYIGATYSNSNASGFRMYTFTHNFNSGTSYNNSLNNQENRGSTSGHFELSSHGWDSGEGAMYWEFRHTASSGNTMYVQFETFGSGPAYNPSWYYRHTTY